ncbi:MAG TPA: hypothetical protein DD727_07105 [Clostridiales bacterium]|nr:hypothetical protein [Clostridiales bacterium]
MPAVPSFPVAVPDVAMTVILREEASSKGTRNHAEILFRAVFLFNSNSPLLRDLVFLYVKIRGLNPRVHNEQDYTKDFVNLSNSWMRNFVEF